MVVRSKFQVFLVRNYRDLRYIENRASLRFSLFTSLDDGGPHGFQLVEASLRWHTEARKAGSQLRLQVGGGGLLDN